MHSRFNEFQQTPLGQQLLQLIDTPNRYIEFAALSRIEVPAVAALCHDLQSHFPEVANHDTARQYCGALVADIMRRHRHELLRPRGRVPGGYFTYGAVWSALPIEHSFETLLEELAQMPARLHTIVERFSPAQWQQKPACGFALVEHLCHLRDLEHEGYQLRLSRILNETLPQLEDFDGTTVAEQRRYLEQDLQAAEQTFTLHRQALIRSLQDLPPTQRQRLGILASQQRITIEELAHYIYRHDCTHLQELEELHTELVSA
ncbi:DinB family protein [Parachitinimonas caeni]|uniref:DinB family protein n=1 Tax=Parachitinimonas caeni TaxID=3031301 RepID=A0ABT7DUB7_9NEIS|nr:DinB family protein [Parachitinimonas caeni]MDK2123652.1 DinB family protein [Parachitinimonas caeni]